MTHKVFSSVPSGFEPFILAREAQKRGVLYVASNENQMAFAEKVLALIAPKLEVLSYPNWDTVPYDRISPSPDIIGEQM